MTSRPTLMISASRQPPPIVPTELRRARMSILARSLIGMEPLLQTKDARAACSRDSFKSAISLIISSMVLTSTRTPSGLLAPVIPWSIHVLQNPPPGNRHLKRILGMSAGYRIQPPARGLRQNFFYIMLVYQHGVSAAVMVSRYYNPLPQLGSGQYCIDYLGIEARLISQANQIGGGGGGAQTTFHRKKACRRDIPSYARIPPDIDLGPRRSHPLCDPESQRLDPGGSGPFPPPLR